MSAKFEVLLPGVIVRVAASSPERVKQFYPEAVQVEPLPDHAEIDHKLGEASRGGCDECGDPSLSSL